MSTDDASVRARLNDMTSTARGRLDDANADLGAAWSVVRRTAFGDGVGVLVFLASLAFAVTTWRVGYLITDNYTLGNALVNLADGHLSVDRIVYGPSGGNTPGMVVFDGQLYGRNYGELFLALPFLWAVEAVVAVAPFTLAVGTAWSLLLLFLTYRAGSYVGRERLGAYAGSALALGAFGLNATLATPLDSTWHAFAALQATTIVAAAFVGVLCYRLGTRVASRRVGAFVGLAAVLATPIGFWASSPKRHVFTALFVLVTLYCLFRSREATDDAAALRFRALAYVPVGATAWVHALEGLVLLGALLVADVLTARRNDARSLVAVAGVLLLSLVPFFLTNLAITGSPIRTPRMLPDYGGGPLDAPSGGASDVNQDARQAAGLLERFVGGGVRALLAAPERVVQTFIRSGYIGRIGAGDGGEAINLTILESAPLLGALVAFPVLWLRALTRRTVPTQFRDLLAARHSPLVAADAFVLVYAAGLTLVNLPRLPIHAQVTVRYLLPLFPLGLYALARLPAVRRAVDERGDLLALSAGATVLGGTPLIFAWVAATGLQTGEIFQLHALLGLAAATPLAAWALATATGRESNAFGAGALGVAAGVGTCFLVLTALSYFAPVGQFALPLTDWLAGALPVLDL